MPETIRSNPKWLKVDSLKKVNLAAEMVLGARVNTWNGPGLTDRHGRPLIMVGHRLTPKDYAENKFGLLFSGSAAEFLRDEALKLLSEGYMEKHKAVPHIWYPKKETDNG